MQNRWMLHRMLTHEPLRMEVWHEGCGVKENITFASAIEAALFMVAHDISPQEYYWKETNT